MGSSGNKCVVVVVIVVAVLVLIIALVATSLKKLASDEVGVSYDTIQKNLGDETKKEGLHTGPPGFEFIIFPSVYKSLDFNDLKCLNKDGVQIILDVTYQYKARAVNLREIILDFRDFDGYEKVLKYAGQSALHEACSYFNTSQFQAERGAFQERVRDIIKARYNALHADITDLQIKDINIKCCTNVDSNFFVFLNDCVPVLQNLSNFVSNMQNCLQIKPNLQKTIVFCRIIEVTSFQIHYFDTAVRFILFGRSYFFEKSKTKNQFWKEVLLDMADFVSSVKVEEDDIISEPIWYNENLKAK
ncbi:hypothetical protein KUTeg_001709 [Tegillarca granosa]|uniref:Band 7 domain-containing protein n=1 Tax=Tegillarca granosa TaxID=220873 RepID=A0ABQ9FS78_TEGGR|nr:hypothetical protein KUTeg_001709 [Tegillarca granosa]